jgi:acetyl-CoA carboxylase carboxyltransferase component
MEMRDSIRRMYEEQTDIRYGAARGWVDAIIAPHDTRLWLSSALAIAPRVGEKQARVEV